MQCLATRLFCWGGSQAVWRKWRRPVLVFMCLWSVWVFICKSSFSLQSPEIPQNFKVSTLWSFALWKASLQKNMPNMKGLQNTFSAVFQFCLISDPAERTTVSCPSNRALPIGMWSESHRDSPRWRQDIVGNLSYKIQDQLKKFRKKNWHVSVNSGKTNTLSNSAPIGSNISPKICKMCHIGLWELPTWPFLPFRIQSIESFCRDSPWIFAIRNVRFNGRFSKTLRLPKQSISRIFHVQ